VTPVILLFGNSTEVTDYASREIGREVVYASQELGTKLDVTVSPFAYAIDADGVVRAKGLLNTPDQLVEMAAAAARSPSLIKILPRVTEHSESSSVV